MLGALPLGVIAVGSGWLGAVGTAPCWIVPGAWTPPGWTFTYRPAARRLVGVRHPAVGTDVPVDLLRERSGGGNRRHCENEDSGHGRSR